ncbi:tetratricopeptide (TPR) repeat protein [Parabacteroides sp. PFB2-10]|uniref:C45 family autoproteolytic acyltransferase/hydolase n=1 Tax=Parabacteroides sp. PFB2-10 TaxID=1742405 RepID=UPI002476CE44|nr:C45 family autoproteolytic acyltransferase/hydolase [Parabacteroides sp. PFB2-10]MDH6313334.1 tetratricopeptide (TPR) repeat protein [Parabacteroides sp. PFB2-10]
MKRIINYFFLGILAVIGLLFLCLAGLYFSADMKQPEITASDLPDYELYTSDSLSLYGPHQLRLDKSGLWELYVEGDALERGAASGKLLEDLLYYQEKVFVDQIREMIPSDSYLKFLRFLLIVFNRHLGEYIPEEFRREIYGISLSCTHKYDMIGTPYERQLNYHAAHDIGHAMQDYMLVGCSSFGLWGAASADSTLLIGRNFDFYMGDDFARHKMVSFYRPTEGYAFAAVGWPGMTGVLSGMNTTGLTVTINAAKSTMPTSAAMPISLLAREILQYASTIEEAYAIAEKRKTFVSESLLIGSAREGKAAVIEKSPDLIGLFHTEGDYIICTNHYQSETFRDDERNRENLATSDSPYRYARLQELLQEKSPVDPTDAADMLRDRWGAGGKEIGLANEKAINQFIAHHSVVFQPEKLLMWVSTTPWQSGEYVAYDLNEIFGASGKEAVAPIDSLAIAADPFLFSPDYNRLLTYRETVKMIRKQIKTGQELHQELVDQLLQSNPEMYYAWELAGDYYATFGEKEEAVRHWQQALTKEIAKQGERTSIEKRIEKIK